MSELADLVKSHDSTALPGYVLSQLDLGDFGELETRLESRAVGFAAAAARHLPADVAVQLMRGVIDDCLAGIYSYGSIYFEAWAEAARNAPELAHLELLKKHADIKPEKAVELVKQNPGCHSAILRMAGFAPRKKTGPPPPKSEAGKSLGEKSSNDSATAPPESPDSVTTKSAA